MKVFISLLISFLNAPFAVSGNFFSPIEVKPNIKDIYCSQSNSLQNELFFARELKASTSKKRGEKSGKGKRRALYVDPDHDEVSFR